MKEVVQGMVRVSMHLLEFIILPLMRVDATLAHHHLAWIIELARLPGFLRMADATNELDWNVAASPQQAAAKLAKVAAVMPPAERVLALGDVNAYPNANSGTWWDFVTPEWLQATEDDCHLLALFRMIIAQSLTQAESNAADSEFQMLTAQALHLSNAAAPTLANLLPVQAAAQCAVWFQRTQPEVTAFRIYRSHTIGAIELARRAIKDAGERMAPLFEVAWREAFPALDKAFPHPQRGSEILVMVMALAVLAKLMTDHFNLCTCMALCGALRTHLPYLATAEMLAASNERRANVLAAHLLGAPSLGGGSSSDASSSSVAATSAEAFGAPMRGPALRDGTAGLRGLQGRPQSPEPLLSRQQMTLGGLVPGPAFQDGTAEFRGFQERPVSTEPFLSRQQTTLRTPMRDPAFQALCATAEADALSTPVNIQLAAKHLIEAPHPCGLTFLAGNPPPSLLLPQSDWGSSGPCP
jgi:hypothetical protein